MVAFTVTEYTETALPSVMGSGTPSRRMMVFIRASPSATNTLSLQTLNANIADVEGVVYATRAGVNFTTAVTWSTYTITAAMGGVCEYALMVTMT